MPQLPTLSATFVAAALAAPLLPAPAAAQRGYPSEREYTAERNATVDARGARRVEVEGQSGTLRVVGVSGISEARVRGTARASREAWLADIKLVARREGDVLVVRADIPDWDERRWGSDDWDEGGTRSLDLVVEVPRGIAARVDDGSGAAEVRGVGALELHDGSGELEIADVASLDVTDGSGELRITGVRGDVRVRDGSGAVVVRDVRGTVTVVSDGSGSIDVNDVEGDFVVERDGSGGIDYADVRGDVSVPRRRR
jgi:hypothetical protein